MPGRGAPDRDQLQLWCTPACTHGPVVRCAHWTCCGAKSRTAHCTLGPVSVGTKVLVCREHATRLKEPTTSKHNPARRQTSHVGVVTGNAADVTGRRCYRVRIIPRFSSRREDARDGRESLDEVVARKDMLPLRLSRFDRELLLAAARNASVSARGLSTRLKNFQNLYPRREEALVYTVKATSKDGESATEVVHGYGDQVVCQFPKYRLLQREDGSIHRIEKTSIQADIVSAHEDVHTAPTRAMRLPDTWEAFACGAKRLFCWRRQLGVRDGKRRWGEIWARPIRFRPRLCEGHVAGVIAQRRSCDQSFANFEEATEECRAADSEAGRGSSGPRIFRSALPRNEERSDSLAVCQRVQARIECHTRDEYSSCPRQCRHRLRSRLRRVRGLLSELDDQRNGIIVDDAYSLSVLRGLICLSIIWSEDADSETRFYQAQREFFAEFCSSRASFSIAMFGASARAKKQNAAAFVASLAKLPACLLLADKSLDTGRARWAFGMLDRLLRQSPSDPEVAGPSRTKPFFLALGRFLEGVLVMRKALFGPRALMPMTRKTPNEILQIMSDLMDDSKACLNSLKKVPHYGSSPPQVSAGSRGRVPRRDLHAALRLGRQSPWSK